MVTETFLVALFLASLADVAWLLQTADHIWLMQLDRHKKTTSSEGANVITLTGRPSAAD
jgi:hypothetical protein